MGKIKKIASITLSVYKKYIFVYIFVSQSFRTSKLLERKYIDHMFTRYFGGKCEMRIHCGI